MERAKEITSYGYVLKSGGDFVLLQSIEMAFHLFAAQQRTRESEERYRVAFMTSPDSVNINKLDGTYVDINEGFTALTGFTRSDVIDELESRFRCKDGTLKTAVMSARLITINGEPHILSITRDVTEKRETEEQLRAAEVALRQSEERFRLAVEGSRDGLWDWNLESDEAYHSSQFAEMLGYKAEELPYTSAAWIDLIHPEDREEAMSRVQQYLSGGAERYESTFRMRAKDGSYRSSQEQSRHGCLPYQPQR